ncbi:hypothetical protein OA955_00460 [Candidatus Marinimicrobia bacterium]|nr:hypothetical protein [Candidatus Neomarinimicrobiota bacterium]
MILNRIEPGTQCKVLSTGEKGILKQIYFYPTKFELEFPDGRISHYTTKQLEIDGISQVEAIFKSPSVPKDGKGESWSDWFPFKHESVVEHHFDTTVDIMWKMLTSLEMYNIWFFGIQRTLPVNEVDRYVHKYSFEHFDLAPGKYFKTRPKSLAPYFKSRIMTIEEKKEFGFSFSTNPFVEEYVHFSLRSSQNGVWVKCTRISEGIFSLLSHFNWEQKSKIFFKLDVIIPKIEQVTENIADLSEDSKHSGGLEALSQDEQVSYLVNKGLDGDMDSVNSNQSKVIRGKVKAMIVKINRGSIERPPMPELSSASTSAESSGGFESLSKEEQIAYLVNKGLDGDMDIINNLDNKVLRARAKAMIVKINRGSIERPPMPELSSASTSAESSGGFESLSKEEQIAYLVNKGLDGDMDIINNLDNKVLRARAKAMIVKINRGSIERPPMPEFSSTTVSSENTSASRGESDEELVNRLITQGLQGDMEEINALDNKVIRGKVKAAIVKEKRKAN